MPAYNPLTQTKECSACHTTFKLAELDENFFKVKAMRDGWASRCKKCYYVKIEPDPTVVAATAAAKAAREPKQVQLVLSHSDKEIRAIEKESGLVYDHSETVGGDFLDPVINQKGQVTGHVKSNAGGLMLVPVFRLKHKVEA